MDKFDLPPDVDMSKFVVVFAMTVLKFVQIFAKSSDRIVPVETMRRTT